MLRTLRVLRPRVVGLPGTIRRSSSSALELVCSGCNTRVSGTDAATFQCSNASKLPDIDHVLVPPPIRVRSDDLSSSNPFVRYRGQLYAYRVALARGMSDEQFVAMAEGLNAALLSTGGTAFKETPLLWHAPLHCFIKVEVGNVAQSHKARHLANAMLYLLALRQTGEEKLGSRRLAVASCGNAGLAAAEVAAAAQWPIDVCIPPNADEAVVARLAELAPRGVATVVCDRSGADVVTAVGKVPSTGAADPTLAVCRELVRAHGSIPFSVQGPECGLAVEGGHTLAWEILTALQRDHASISALGSVYVQVGGGALGAGLMQGMHRVLVDGSAEAASLRSEPRLVCVQPEGCQPLQRAWEAVQASGLSAHEAANDRPQYMWAWDNPHSIAHGILDDETYEWVALCDAMARTRGGPITVAEEAIVAAHAYARDQLGVTVCHTGAAGLAALMEKRAAQPAVADAPPDLVVLSGLDRSVGSPAQGSATQGNATQGNATQGSAAHGTSSSRPTAVVVGSGCFGVGAAYFLARAGMQVTVLDKRAGIAQGTSKGNASSLRQSSFGAAAGPGAVPNMLKSLWNHDGTYRLRLGTLATDTSLWRWGIQFLRTCGDQGAINTTEAFLRDHSPYFGRLTRAVAEAEGFAERVDGAAETLVVYVDAGADGVSGSDGQAPSASTAAAYDAAAAKAALPPVVPWAAMTALSPDEAVVREPALAGVRGAIAGALHPPHDTLLDSHGYTTELASVCEAKYGVRFVHGDSGDVVGLEADAADGRVRGLATADGGTLAADVVVVANGSQAPKLLSPLGCYLPIYPVKGYSLTYDVGDMPPDEAPSNLLIVEPAQMYVSRFGSRLRFTSIAEFAGWDEDAIADDCVRVLRHRAEALFPAATKGQQPEVWCGGRPLTPDDRPISSRVPATPNLYVHSGGGQYGWRVALGTSEHLADLIRGDHLRDAAPPDSVGLEAAQRTRFEPSLLSVERFN